MKNKPFYLVPLFVLFLSSCQTYLIPKDSFIHQFENQDSSNLITVDVLGPLSIVYKYEAISMDSIECVDKRGMTLKLKITPSLELHLVNEKTNKETVFYLDRTILKKSQVIGSKSKLMTAITEKMPLDNINRFVIKKGAKIFRNLELEPVVLFGPSKIIDKEQVCDLGPLDQQAEFPGGDIAMINFIANRISYTQKALNLKISGTVIVSFVVGKDGVVRDVRLLNDIGGGLGRLAAMAVWKMPRWQPCTLNGNKVARLYNIPVNFRLH